MKKYYAKIEVDYGEIVLVVRGQDEQSAKDKLHRNYNFNRLIEIKDTPFKLMPNSSATNSSLNASGIIHYLTTFRSVNSWG